MRKDLEHNLAVIKGRLGGNQDVVIHPFVLGRAAIKAALFYVDGLVDKDVIGNDILKPLKIELPLLEVSQDQEQTLVPALMEMLSNRGITTGEIKKENQFEKLFLAALSGDVVLLVDGCAEALVIGVRGWESRGIGEPYTEALIRGPRDGFTETLRTNTVALRRRLRDPGFRLESMRLGKRTKTDMVLCYIEDIVNNTVLEEIRRRLDTVDIDAILESGYIEQLIEDSFLSPFPQVQYTERPDKAAAAILEGRVVILVDTTPFALIVPATFAQFFQSPEDYYERWIIGSLTRLIRIIASYIAVFLPGVYVAAVSFHPGLIPTKLALAIAAAREGMPFPVVVEALLMEISFEFLREAGARLPRAIGQTIGIVGGLIIGEAAVRANVTSPIMVIIVALTAIASFAIPSYNLGIGFRMLRFPLILLAGTFGLYGVVLGFIVVNIHMVSLKSFGVSYLSPFAPYQVSDWKDLLIRAPIRTMIKRPVLTGPQDTIRQKNRKKEGW
ncbi:MAG TPA: spore germination protein [Clostridia bacterium]|nr:spore germination protein [Clostridia bacterium]